MNSNIVLHHGDCVEVLKGYGDGSVGAVVSDPPYGLSFMGKDFDKLGEGAAQREWHRAWVMQAFRVLVPGGTLKAFSGTRTFHHLGCALQEAGFLDIRLEAWNYGSGFPKSMNIGKQIDKSGGHPLGWFVTYVRAVCEERGIPTREITALLPSRNGNMTGWFRNKVNGTQDLTVEQFNAIKDFLGLPFADLAEAEREVVGQRTTGIGTGRGAIQIMRDGNRDITAPATDAARTWDGWGTALKPSWEPVLVGTKPA